MPRASDGTYSLPAGYAATNGVTADASQHNEPLEDIQAVLSAALPEKAGGTGARSFAAARTNLGLEIGADVQAYNANLASLAGLTLASGNLLKATGAATVAQLPVTSFAETILDDADAATARTTLGVYSTAQVDSAISAAAENLSTAPVFVLEDQRSSGTNGGTASTSWGARPLQTVVRNESSAVALASNQFTPAQDVWVEFGAVIYQRTGKVRIWNVTDGVQAGISYAADPNSFPTSVMVTGGCLLLAGKTYELQDIVNGSVNGNDRGAASSLGTEVYARVVGWLA